MLVVVTFVAVTVKGTCPEKFKICGGQMVIRRRFKNDRQPSKRAGLDCEFSQAGDGQSKKK